MCGLPTLEGESLVHSMDDTISITTIPNLRASHIIQAAYRTHQRMTRNSTLMSTPAIVRPPTALRRSLHTHPQQETAPEQFTSSTNSSRILFSSTIIVSQEAVHVITNRVWDIPGNRWTPNNILKHSPTTLTISLDSILEHSPRPCRVDSCTWALSPRPPSDSKMTHYTENLFFWNVMIEATI